MAEQAENEWLLAFSHLGESNLINRGEDTTLGCEGYHKPGVDYAPSIGI
jgi:hypothetical protein